MQPPGWGGRGCTRKRGAHEGKSGSAGSRGPLRHRQTPEMTPASLSHRQAACFQDAKPLCLYSQPSSPHTAHDASGVPCRSLGGLSPLPGGQLLNNTAPLEGAAQTPFTGQGLASPPVADTLLRATQPGAFKLVLSGRGGKNPARNRTGPTQAQAGSVGAWQDPSSRAPGSRSAVHKHGLTTVNTEHREKDEGFQCARQSLTQTLTGRAQVTTPIKMGWENLNSKGSDFPKDTQGLAKPR